MKHVCTITGSDEGTGMMSSQRTLLHGTLVKLQRSSDVNGDRERTRDGGRRIARTELFLFFLSVYFLLLNEL